MNISYSIPWDDDKNILQSYIHEMKKLKNPDDWCVFIDGDACFTHNFYGLNIRETIMANEQYSMFTCFTNRVNCKYQLFPDINKTNNDMEYHRNVGYLAFERYGTSVRDITGQQPLSGVMMAFKKSAWNAVIKTMNNKSGMLQVDNELHRKMKAHGFKVGLMQGIYVFHWYRNNNKLDHKHLLK